MTRRFILPLLVLLPACSDVDELPTQPIVPTFAISGTIHDVEGNNVIGAHADALGTPYAGQRTVSNDEGYFSIKGVAGPLTLRVWKEGYEEFYLPLVVTSDTTVDITLPRFEFADSLVLGQSVRSYVSATASPCDPLHWDARAPCRVFHFFAPASGRLGITVSWRGAPPLDMTLVTPDGEYIAYSSELASETVALEASVVQGTLYEIRINSYYDYQEFDLRADLFPETLRPHPRRGAGELIRKP